MAALSQIAENIDQNLKSQAMLMSSKNSFLITSQDFQSHLTTSKAILNSWVHVEAEIRAKAASVMNLKLMIAIDHAAQCNRDLVELLEEIIELQNNEELMKRINALGKSSVEIDTTAEIAAIEDEYGIILEGLSKQDYYLEISNAIFNDIKKHPNYE